MEEPTKEALQAAGALLEQLPIEVADEVRQAFLNSGSAEEFATRILVGNCPKCGGLETGNCENDPDIGELLVGRCYDCGQLWCTVCGRLLEPKAAVCDCWNEEEI
jgi:hypothetical protein